MRLEEIATPLRFVVTVDTEGDDAWSSPDDVRLENLRELPRFQDLCDEHAVVPTYLLAYECATRDEALSVLKPIADRGRCEIGHHLHVWTTPPFHREGPKGVDGEWIQAFQFQLPDSLFVEKAESLRQAIEKSFESILFVAYENGGSLLKFGGDALLLWFEGQGHATRACRASMRMRRALRSVGRIEVPGAKLGAARLTSAKAK